MVFSGAGISDALFLTSGIFGARLDVSFLGGTTTRQGGVYAFSLLLALLLAFSLFFSLTIRPTERPDKLVLSLFLAFF